MLDTRSGDRPLIMRFYPAIVVLMAVLSAVPLLNGAHAQQRIGHVDSDQILSQTPEFANVQQQLDRLAQQWREELEEERRALDEMFREYQARELLYTQEERQRRREDIVRAEEDLERLRVRYFGPEGELFQQQDNLMRPIQERILEAIENVAVREGYDYVFDRKGEFLFMYAREQYDLTDAVLAELGIDLDTN